MKRSLMIIGVFAVICGAGGLIFNFNSMLGSMAGKYQNIVDQNNLYYFYSVFYTMSIICIACYLVLIFCGINFFRMKIRYLPIFVGVMVFEVIYFLLIRLIQDDSVLSDSIAAAMGVANGGLMIQFTILFPLWGCILAVWVNRKLKNRDNSDELTIVGSNKQKGLGTKKKFVVGLAFAVIVLLVPMFLIYYFYPEIVFDTAIDFQRYSSQLVNKESKLDDHRLVYLEGGKGDPILFLHGFGSDKDTWVPFAKYLTPKYHLLIPDIPGFGESSKLPTDNYDVKSQIARIDEFTKLKKLTKFHLVGNSGGGMMAAIYSATYPEKVLSLTLIAPTGLRTAKLSEYLKQVKNGNMPELISGTDDYDKWRGFAHVKQDRILAPLKKVAISRAISARPFNEKILNDIKKENLDFESYLPMIKAPTLAIWGDLDKIADVSGLSVLEKNIKDCKTIIIKNTGHFPMREKAEDTSIGYIEFLKNKK